MSSPVNWALLGLVIERPSYGYELAQRFDRVYEEVLPLSSLSHIYAALNALESRGLVEKLAGAAAAGSEERQPKPHYASTQAGAHAYREWLVEQMHEDRRRSRLMVHQLAALAREPQAALALLERYEELCLRQANELPEACVRDGAAERAGGLLQRLLCEENRMASRATLAWVQFARREFTALREPRGPRR